MLLGLKLSCVEPTDACLLQSVTVPSFGLGKVADGGGGNGFHGVTRCTCPAGVKVMAKT